MIIRVPYLLSLFHMSQRSSFGHSYQISFIESTPLQIALGEIGSLGDNLCEIFAFIAVGIGKVLSANVGSGKVESSSTDCHAHLGCSQKKAQYTRNQHRMNKRGSRDCCLSAGLSAFEVQISVSVPMKQCQKISFRNPVPPKGMQCAFLLLKSSSPIQWRAVMSLTRHKSFGAKNVSKAQRIEQQ